jgi:hypothetical protein
MCPPTTFLFNGFDHCPMSNLWSNSIINPYLTSDYDLITKPCPTFNPMANTWHNRTRFNHFMNGQGLVSKDPISKNALIWLGNFVVKLLFLNRNKHPCCGRFNIANMWPCENEQWACEFHYLSNILKKRY